MPLCVGLPKEALSRENRVFCAVGDLTLRHSGSARELRTARGRLAEIACHVESSVEALHGVEPRLERRVEQTEFEVFFDKVERPIRFALCARFGFEGGRDAASEALAYAWEHWKRISKMDNPAGYVYRVGYRIGRKAATRFDPVEHSRSDTDLPNYEPGLTSALAKLSARQRTVVVLVHGLGWTHKQAAHLLGLSPSTVQKHAERGLVHLRQSLGVDHEA